MRKLSILFVVALGACAAGETLEARRVSALEGSFANAAAESGVPASVLKGVAWVESRFRPVPNAGLTGLAAGGRVRGLERAVALTGIDAETLVRDPQASLRGGAAILRDLAERHFGRAPSVDPRELGDWYPVVLQYADVDDPQLADWYASEVFAAMARGEARELEDGWIELEPTPTDYQSHRLFGTQRSYLQPDYTLAHWSASPNFTAGRTEYGAIVIHTTERAYAAALTLYKDAGSHSSVHYVVRSSDGDITQLVEEKDTAWHADCFDGKSVGVAHEAVATDPAWFTDAMYAASAKLVRFIADRHSIPRDRQHIVGHSEVPAACNPGHAADPGPNWNWAKYMALVGEFGKLTGAIFEDPDMTKRISGATVKLVGTTQSVVTGADGLYTFSLNPGTYTVEVSKTGWTTGSVTRTVTAGGTIWGSIGIKPATPALGAYKGKVYVVNPSDPSDLSQAVAGATVSLSSGAKVTTGTDGLFAFQVPAGTYTATAAKTGYNSATSTRTVVAGADVWGSIGITPVAAADKGWLKGKVFVLDPANPTDMSQVIAGATVALSNGQSALTGSDGAYAFELAPGSYTATASKTGYQSASATRTVVADDTAWGSIGLTAGVAADTQPPTITIDSPADNASFDVALVRIKGTASDDSGKIARLSSALNGGTATTQVLSNGSEFDFAVALMPGENLLEIEATDASGNSGLEAITLVFRSGLSGYVHRKGDEAARISGASLQLQDLAGTEIASATTGPDGSYAIDADTGNYRLVVSFAGFQPHEQLVTVSGDARVQVKVALEPETEPVKNPEIEITSPGNGETVRTSPVTVVGVTRNFEVDAIAVNGVTATLQPNGSFSAVVALKPNVVNLISARAKGKAGEQLEDTVEVIYQAPTAADAGIEESPDASDPAAPAPIEDGGCGCSTGSQPASFATGLLALGLLRRRRGTVHRA